MPTPQGMFGAERSALQAIPAPQTPFSLLGMLRGAGTGILDLMELGQTATRPEDIPPSAALAVPAVGGMFGAAFAPRGALAAGAARPGARGLTFKWSKEGEFPKLTAEKDGNTVGEMWLKSNNSGVGDVRVSEKHRRQGIGTAMYDEAGRMLGSPLAVTDNLSRDAFRFWKARDPEQVKNSLYNFEDNLLGNKAKWSKNKPASEIVDVRNDFVSVRAGSGTMPVYKDQLAEQGLIPSTLLSANPATAAVPGMFGSMGPQQERAAILRGDLL